MMTLESVLAFLVPLIGGAVGAECLTRWTPLPRVMGYTLIGSLLALSGQGVKIPLDGWPYLVVEGAVALMLFEMGTHLRLRWLTNNRALLMTSVLEAGCTGLLIWVGLMIFQVSVLASATVAVVTLPTSAAVVGHVAQASGSEGQVTQRMMALTALNTFYAIVLMIPLLAAARMGHFPDPGLALELTVGTTLAALAMALLLALLVYGVTRWLNTRHDDVVLLVLALVLSSVVLSRMVEAPTLLAPLLAGIVLRQVSDRAWSWPTHFGSAGGLLVLVMFVLVGSTWSIEALKTGGALATFVAVVRSVSKTGVVTLLSRWSGLNRRQGLALGITLTPLSATTLLLLSEVLHAAPHLKDAIAPIIVSIIALLGLIGPLAVQWGLHKAGETPEGQVTRS